MNKTTISLKHPTPMWARKTVRAISWGTMIWAMLLASGLNLTDFGVSEALSVQILKGAAILTGASSMLSRFLGIEPVNLNQ